MKKAVFTWSGGKDSTLALYELQKNREYEIQALLTTITENYGRISMHGIRNDLLDRQAESLGLPLEKVCITTNSSNEEYEAKMEDVLTLFKKNGALYVVYGDIFLEDLRKYREDNLRKINMKAVFPIWKRETSELARTFIQKGFRAVATCVDTSVLDRGFAGREFDEQFLADLPAGVDPCGENGEFHTFVYAGPVFSEEILIEKGEVVLRDNRFCFCDLMPR